ncbi:MAG: hypothetical protein ACOY3I_06560 [Verrucomicrobiota bacterium]
MEIRSKVKKGIALGAVIAAAAGIFGYEKGKSRTDSASDSKKVENPIDQRAAIRNPENNSFMSNLFLLMTPNVDGLTSDQFKSFTEIHGHHCIFKMRDLDKNLLPDHPLKKSHDYHDLLKSGEGGKGIFSYRHNDLTRMAHLFGRKVDLAPERFLTNTSASTYYADGKRVLSEKVGDFLDHAGVERTPTRFQEPNPLRPDTAKMQRNLRRGGY